MEYLLALTNGMLVMLGRGPYDSLGRENRNQCETSVGKQI